MTTEQSDDHAARRVAAIYNSAVASWAIAAAWEVGALDELARAGTLDAAEFAARRGLDRASTVGMIRALSTIDVVTRTDNVATVSRNFAEVFRTKSFFHWLSRGSAELFRQMPANLVEGNRVGEYYQRDAAAIAYACREINAICYDETFWAAMGRVDVPFGRFADLGCGGGARVIEILNRYPGSSGIGIDIAPPAIKVAREEAASAGVADRAEFVLGDVLDLDPHPAFEKVELVTCFLMGHDFWPKEQCVATLRHLRERFPVARRLLIGDATRTIGIDDADLPIFTLGFELGHDLMGATIPTVADWEEVFEQGGWKLLRTNRISVAVGEVIFELS